ncbi:MAG TPA: iron ABC transporter permease, partial [Methylobacterium sp.]
MSGTAHAPRLEDLLDDLSRPSAGLSRARPRLRGLAWSLGGIALVVLVLSPLLSLAVSAAQGSGELWPHLLAHVLPQALADTGLLLLGVGLLVVGIGTGTAWLVSAYEFPGRRLLD